MSKKEKVLFILKCILAVGLIFYLFYTVCSSLFLVLTPVQIGRGRLIYPISMFPLALAVIWNLVCTISKICHKKIKRAIRVIVTLLLIILSIMLFDGVHLYTLAHSYNEETTEVQQDDFLLSKYYQLPQAIDKHVSVKTYTDALYYGSEVGEKLEFDSYYLFSEKSIMKADCPFYAKVFFKKYTKNFEGGIYLDSNTYFCREDSGVVYYCKHQDGLLLVLIMGGVPYSDEIQTTPKEELISMCEAEFEALQKEHAFN